MLSLYAACMSFIRQPHSHAKHNLFLKLIGSAFALGVIRFCYLWLNRARRLRQLTLAVKQRNNNRLDDFAKTRRALQGTPSDLRAEIVHLELGTLIEWLHDCKVTPVQVLHAYQEAALKAHQRTHCLVQVLTEAESWALQLMALSDQERRALPLFGVPFSVKESIRMKGFNTTRGYAGFMVELEKEDAVSVRVLRDLGAIPFVCYIPLRVTLFVMVRTTIPQSMLNYSCANPIFGCTSTPDHPARTSGGSSGGEGALLACGGAPFGLGSDVGGSIRIPSHFCGTSGFKPSRSRISQNGNYPCVPGRPMTGASQGPMANKVSTLEFITKLLVESQWANKVDPYKSPLPWTPVEPRKLRIGYYFDDGWFTPVPACQRAVRITKDALSAQGHTLVPFQPPNVALAVSLFAASATVDGGKAIMDLVKQDIAEPSQQYAYFVFGLPQIVLRMFMRYLAHNQMWTMFRNLPWTSSDLRKVYSAIEEYRTQFVRVWQGQELDAIICPALGTVSLPHNIPQRVPGAVSYTALYNTLDFPAGCVPCTKVEQQDIDTCKRDYPQSNNWYKLMHAANSAQEALGLSVGVQCATLPHKEELCLHLMALIQQTVQSD